MIKDNKMYFYFDGEWGCLFDSGWVQWSTIHCHLTSLRDVSDLKMAVIEQCKKEGRSLALSEQTKIGG